MSSTSSDTASVMSDVSSVTTTSASSPRCLFRVISCESDVARRTRFFKMAECAKLSHVPRQKGVDGRRFSQRKICKLIKRGVVDRRAELTPIEVAISLSHRKCWEALVRSKATYMTVFEDDAKPAPNFKEGLEALLASETLAFDILHLVNGNWNQTRTWREPVGRVDGMRVFRETLPYLPGTGCYVIHRDFAKVLLERQFPILESVDYYIGFCISVRKYRHLTLDTRRDEENRLYIVSPLLAVDPPIIGSEFSTQRYDMPKMCDHRCDACYGLRLRPPAQ